MFVSWQKFIFLLLLLFPILAMLSFHSNKEIKKIVRIILILTLIFISFITPIIILISLKYLSLLVISLPIIFRSLGIVINKLDLKNFTSKLSKDIIIQLLITTIGSFILVLLTIDYDIWSGLWLSLAIIIFSGTIILSQIDKSRLLYSVAFGVLSFIITPILKDEKGLVTYFVSWAVCAIPFYYVPQIKKFIKYEIVPFVLIPILSIIIIKNGGVSFIWNKFYSAIFLITVIQIIIGCTYYICEINKNKLPLFIKQYYLPIVMIIVEFTLIYFKNKYYIFNYVISTPLLIIGIEMAIIYITRFIYPFLYNLTNKSLYTVAYNTYEMFLLVCGKNLGAFFYKILIGTYHKKLKFFEIFLGVCLALITSICAILLTSKSVTFDMLASTIIPQPYIYNSLLVFFMAMSSMTLLDCIIQLFNNGRFNVGLSNDEAINLSSTISVNYLFLTIYYLYLFLPSIEKIGIYTKLIFVLWLLAVSLSIYISLSTDLVIKKYNDLKNTRYFISVLLYGGVSLFVTIYSSLTDSLYLINHMSIINIFNKYCYIIIFSSILSKLIGFDTGIASRKLRIYHIKDSIKLLFIISFAGITLTIVGIFILKLSKSIYITNFTINILYLNFMLSFVKSVIISIMPSKNDINESLMDYLTFKSIKYKKSFNK